MRKLPKTQIKMFQARADDQSRPTPGTFDASENSPTGANVHDQLAPFARAMSSLTNELHNLSSVIASQQYAHTGATSLTGHEAQHRKRKRAEDNGNDIVERHKEINTLSAEIFEAYFQFIQPWLSVLHEPSIRKHGFKDRSDAINQAITFAALRFVRKHDENLSREFVTEQMSKAKKTVITQAIDNICVGNVQALLILTYIELVDDNIQKAYSLIGIIARHIEYLQLYQELLTSNGLGGVFGKIHQLLPSVDWIEEEEKRRAFWIAIMLDRFCAAITGCRPSISGPNIKRRLPVCASYWFTNQAHATPYMHVSDVSTGDLGQPIPHPQPSTADSLPDDTRSTFDGEVSSSSGIGALAFYVETVESMSMVVGLFLQSPVNFSDRNDVSLWLIRFKELDAYLMRWKTRLPRQWADSGVSRRLMAGIMDPAMAAANATHNTCLILLHSEIAYPDTKLRWVQLPSLCSAEICVNAAVEVCIIVRKFIAQRNARYPLSPQLGLCAFVSARSLLLQWRYYLTPIASEFWLLLQSLDDMARRWQPYTTSDEMRAGNLFSRFAERLRTIHARCELDPTFRIDRTEPLYQDTTNSGPQSSRHWIQPSELALHIEKMRSAMNLAATPQTVARNTTSSQDIDAHNDGSQARISVQPGMTWDPMASMEPSVDEDNLLAISQALMGPDFTGLDRIVSFDEMMLGGISETPMNWDFGQT
ncbi:hypothetical protein N0V90_002946 [Kalmusia sp. IMI 367209]|nr:hypothetical protein N0V90_002946 [Kalmusia sp. IMI 367209]